MARPRTIPDSAVLAAVRRLISTGGEKAVAFSAVAQASGLAPASLAQRYGSVAGMIEAAAADAVTAGLADLARVEEELPGKSPQAMLKALEGTGPDAACLAILMRSAAGRQRAEEFRAGVEAALGRRLGPKSAGAAAALFAAWQGAQLWGGGGDAGFKMKAVAKKLV
jgi:AcrR family transcriptional regulator